MNNALGSIIGTSFGVSFLVAPWMLMLIWRARWMSLSNLRLMCSYALHSPMDWLLGLDFCWLAGLRYTLKQTMRQRVFTFIVWLTGGGLLTFWWLAYLLCIDRALWEPGDLRPSFWNNIGSSILFDGKIFSICWMVGQWLDWASRAIWGESLILNGFKAVGRTT